MLLDYYTRRRETVSPSIVSRDENIGDGRTAAVPTTKKWLTRSNPSKEHHLYHYFTLLQSTMKFIVLLSTLAVAAGFAPGLVGRQSNALFMAEDTKTGTVKW
jgi:hypothetical protein